MKKIKYSVLLTLIILNFSFANSIQSEFSPQIDEVNKISCKNEPRRVEQCYWVTGTLQIGNGNPATRIKISHSSRILGIKDDEKPILPLNISSKLTTENEIFGNYYFCPFSRYKRGQMQNGCIEKARNLKVK